MKKTLFTIAMMTTIIAAQGQEALWSGTQVKSPVVNADGTVTFSMKAPADAHVSVSGDFLRPMQIDTPQGKAEVPGKAELKQDAKLDPANVYVNRDVASLTSIFIVSETKGDRGDLYRVNEVPHGDVSKVWYDSPTLKTHRRMTVYTPAGYDKGKDYPVLYLLHGAGGDEEAWTTLGRTAQIMDNLIAMGKAKPMVVVMPNGNPASQAAPGEWSRGMYQPSFRGSAGPQNQPVATMDESFPDIFRHLQALSRPIRLCRPLLSRPPYRARQQTVVLRRPQTKQCRTRPVGQIVRRQATALLDSHRQDRLPLSAERRLAPLPRRKEISV